MASAAVGTNTNPSSSCSLTVPNTARATVDIQRTPGGVEVVPDTALKNGPANTVKDVLGWVPGVLIQTRWDLTGEFRSAGPD